MLRCIVIQGPPAAGKTALVTRLANDTAIGYVTKDSIKELLYDTLGAPITRDESRAYGATAIIAMKTLLMQLANSHRTILYESALRPDIANVDFKELRARGVTFAQVYCYAEPEVLLARYEARIANGERHKGHPDIAGTHTIEDAKVWVDDYGMLDIEDTFSINTAEFDETQYAQLVDWINERKEG